jgi:hypothetical protein
MRAWVTGCFPAVALAAGVAVGGWFIGDGLIHARLGDRFVTVKGLAERIVKADLAVWPIRFIATGNDLPQVQNQITKDAETVREFMNAAGISSEEMVVHGLEVTDLYAETYHQGPIENRFIMAQTLVIRSENVDQIASASQRISKLVASGVVLSGRAGPWGGGPLYLFTQLTELKPEMIAEATRDAHAAAEQFATDSASQLGGIRKANQGLFQILPRDKIPTMQEEEQIYKTLRVVSTIEYFLQN